MNTRSFSAGHLLFFAIIAYFMTDLDEDNRTAVDVPIMASSPGLKKVSPRKLDNTQVFEINEGARTLSPFLLQK